MTIGLQIPSFRLIDCPHLNLNPGPQHNRQMAYKCTITPRYICIIKFFWPYSRRPICFDMHCIPQLRKIKKFTTVVSNKFIFTPSFAVHPESSHFEKIKFQKNSKMTITLYGDFASGPCRMVAMTLEFVEKKYNYKVVSLASGEHKSPDYLKVSNWIDKSTKLVYIDGVPYFHQ